MNKTDRDLGMTYVSAAEKQEIDTISQKPPETRHYRSDIDN